MGTGTGMTFRRRLPRGLFGCAIALAIAMPALAAPPGETAKLAKAATPAPPADEKTAKAKPAATKSAKSKAAKSKSAAKPAAKSAKVTPLPRVRPVIVASAVPMAPARATLSPTPILPTARFSPITPAAAATLNPPVQSVVASAEPAYVPPARTAALHPSPLPVAESSATPASEVVLVKQALDLVRHRKTGEATALEKTIGDPLARKLVEWTIVRSDENDAGFDRLSAFSHEKPSWPNAKKPSKPASFSSLRTMVHL